MYGDIDFSVKGGCVSRLEESGSEGGTGTAGNFRATRRYVKFKSL